MIIALPTLDTRRLAADLCELVRADTSPDQLARINSRNAAETDAEIDHVNDYCDAGELLAAAIRRQFGNNWEWSEINPAVLDDCFAAARQTGYQLRRILLACEYSATVRDRLAVDGHSVLSCDLLPSDAPGPHYQGDVRDVINDGWSDMLAFPPCTYLTTSAEWCYRDVQTKQMKPGTLIGADRRQARAVALDFVRLLLDADIERIALENPAGVIGTNIRPADQYVQPNNFGDDASKKTGWWLKKYPLLKKTKQIAGRLVKQANGKTVERWANQTDSGQNILGPSIDRWKLRSKTYPGIADAITRQWFPTMEIVK